MARYTVDYGIKHPVKLPASSLKNARKLAYGLVEKGNIHLGRERMALIYLGDDIDNGVDGSGEYEAWVENSPRFKRIIYSVHGDGVVKYYPVNPDGTLGSLLHKMSD